jgi:hypothetical protein
LEEDLVAKDDGAKKRDDIRPGYIFVRGRSVIGPEEDLVAKDDGAISRVGGEQAVPFMPPPTNTTGVAGGAVDVVF